MLRVGGISKKKGTGSGGGFPGQIPPTLFWPRVCPVPTLRDAAGGEAVTCGHPAREVARLPHCSLTQPGPPASVPGLVPHGETHR